MKVLVLGGTGAAGKIHVRNLLKLGCQVANLSSSENDNVSKNYKADSTDYE
jgi:NADPH:quinone reductase-like Zn-dependent oxidoreductase